VILLVGNGNSEIFPSQIFFRAVTSWKMRWLGREISMGGGEEEKHTKLWRDTLKEVNHLENLSVVGQMTQK
jgi:hypothetical protein